MKDKKTFTDYYGYEREITAPVEVEKKLERTEVRLTKSDKLKLMRLAGYYDVSQNKLIENLINEEFERLEKYGKL